MSQEDIKGGHRPPLQNGRDHQELAAEAEREAEDLEHQGDKLEEDIDAAKGDWERKQEDESVPGAIPDPGGEGDDSQDEAD